MVEKEDVRGGGVVEKEQFRRLEINRLGDGLRRTSVDRYRGERHESMEISDCLRHRDCAQKISVP